MQNLDALIAKWVKLSVAIMSQNSQGLAYGFYVENLANLCCLELPSSQARVLLIFMLLVINKMVASRRLQLFPLGFVSLANLCCLEIPSSQARDLYCMAFYRSSLSKDLVWVSPSACGSLAGIPLRLT